MRMQRPSLTITINIAPSAATALRSLAAILFVALLPGLHAQQDVHAGLTPPAKRQPAPAFNLLNQDGKIVRLADLRGKIVLLNFWATDCGGCVLEIPSFVELEKTFSSPAFSTVGVSMDISYESLKSANEAWERVRPFMAKHNMNYPILMGDQAVSKNFALRTFPATYLIDRSGKVAVSYVGVLIDRQAVAANIKRLQSEP